MRGGIGLVIMGVIVIVANFVICFGGAMLAGLGPGYAPGLISGSYTVTAVIGVATSAIQGGGWTPPRASPPTRSRPTSRPATPSAMSWRRLVASC